MARINNTRAVVWNKEERKKGEGIVLSEPTFTEHTTVSNQKLSQANLSLGVAGLDFCIYSTLALKLWGHGLGIHGSWCTSN